MWFLEITKVKVHGWQWYIPVSVLVVGVILIAKDTGVSVIGAGLWVGFPWFSLQPKRPRVLLSSVVPTGLEPLTGLLGLIGHLGVVSWSKG